LLRESPKELHLHKPGYEAERTEGKNVTITIKGKLRVVDNHKVRKEINFPLKNLKEAQEFCDLIGVKHTSTVEIKREYYKFYNCSVEIVQWPTIPPYMEIEGSPSNILKVAKLLGFSKKDFFPRRVEDYYKGLKKKKSLTFSNEI